MFVDLDPRLEALIRRKMESGRYHDESDVVREALELLEEQERLEELRAALAIGQAQIDRGETVVYTPELRQELKREARRLAQAGHEPSADVCP
jgi:antitoxin ParD1/3/4